MVDVAAAAAELVELDEWDAETEAAAEELEEEEVMGATTAALAVVETTAPPAEVVVATTAAEEVAAPTVAGAVEAEAVKQVVDCPGRMVNVPDGLVRPSESRMTRVHEVPAARLTSQVIEVALVVPTVTSGAAPACPPG